jgi:hypothetical protein
MFDVPADFLGADQTDFHLVVIHVRDVRTAVDPHVKTRLAHFLDRSRLQTAFGQSQPQHRFGLRRFLRFLRCCHRHEIFPIAPQGPV